VGSRASVAIAVCLAWVIPFGPVRALETDQFTVPDAPLSDIGAELNGHALDVLRDIVREANDKGGWHAVKAANSTGFWRERHLAQAAEYQSEEYFCRRLYEELGTGGTPECRVERWVRHHRFAGGGVAVFRPDRLPGGGVYAGAPFPKPLLLGNMSPTVNVYGAYLGVDKVGHFFQQGFEYYREYEKERAAGGDEAQALARAVRLGVEQERGFFGLATVGVYSNADLACNYAGLKFYLNLTRAIRIGDATLPPFLVRDEHGGWRFNPDRPTDDLLRAFVGDHFNEALNPSSYEQGLRDTVRKNVRRVAPRIVSFYECTPEGERARLAELSTWHGEPYGHSEDDGLITILDTCFDHDTRAP
jgi:hypothetical protein